MAGERTIAGVAAALPIANLDTDQIMPKQFLRGIDKSGLDRGVLHDLRFDAEGAPRRDFILNRAEYAGCKILVAGENFGCGSSREHAVWGLLQFGIRAVIAPSFGDIFFSNALKNGLLPVRLPEPRVEALLGLLQREPGARIRIDLAAQRVHAGDGGCDEFEIDPFARHCLLEGLDELDYTLGQSGRIADFERERASSFSPIPSA